MLVQATIFDELDDTPDGVSDLQRCVDALTCLRDVVPEALEVLVHLSNWRSRDRHGSGASGDWCFSVHQMGVSFGPRSLWEPGYRPPRMVTWDELTDLLADHPDRPAVIAWSQSLTAVDAWKDRYRPYRLWPDPETWHPHYLADDLARPGADARFDAWATTQQIFTDTIHRIKETP